MQSELFADHWVGLREHLLHAFGVVKFFVSRQRINFQLLEFLLPGNQLKHALSEVVAGKAVQIALLVPVG